MASVLIDSQAYQVYADVDQANEYAAGEVGDDATAWDAATDTAKAKALISATRILDRQSWGSDYDTFAEREAVENIVNASILIAMSLNNGGELNTARNVTTQKRLKAGSVEIEAFRPSSDSETRFPLNIQELLKGYIGSGATYFGPVSAGTDRCSISPLDLGYDEGV